MTRRITKGNIFANPTELQGYERVIETLEQRISAKNEIPESEFAFQVTEKSPINKYIYAQELKRQIEAKKHQKELEKVEQTKPAISEDFYGYPNLPQTPRKLKRERELQQKRAIREDLTQQLLLKKEEEDSVKFNRLEYEKRSNKEDIFRMHEDTDKKVLKKAKEKEILVSAWGLAQRAKELQDALDSSVRKKLLSKSVDAQSENIPATSMKTPLYIVAEDRSLNNINPYQSETRIRNQNVSVPPRAKYEKHEKNEKQEKTEKHLKHENREKHENHERYEKNERRQAIRNRALRVQQNLESKAKNSYQYKIKQIIDQAKQIRSLQPGHLNTRLNFSPI